VPFSGGRISNEKAVFSGDFIKSITLILLFLRLVRRVTYLAKIRKILYLMGECFLIFLIY